MSGSFPTSGPLLFGIPIVFILFGMTLIGIIVLPKWTLQVSLVGLAAIAAVRIGASHFDPWAHLAHEWAKLANLFGLLVGFAVLADHVEASHLPAALPRVLPRGALGCFTVLVLVWLLSGVLDNIAAAVIGATIAARIFARRVHLGYLAAIVTAANAGGAGSVLGDTTTTMIWIQGISPLTVLPAYIGAGTALLVFGVIASRQQVRHAPMANEQMAAPRIDTPRLGIVALALVATVCTNLAVSGRHGGDAFPFLACALWSVLIIGTALRPLNWRILPSAARGSAFLLALVLAASLMPIEWLPVPGVTETLMLGFVSSVFDNIPLTKLALDQGGYDWALLAYSVGCGGSIVWFGSSAGVAVSAVFPEARSVAKWLRAAWHIPLAFVVGFAALFVANGWHPR